MLNFIYTSSLFVNRSHMRRTFLFITQFRVTPLSGEDPCVSFIDYCKTPRLTFLFNIYFYQDLIFIFYSLTVPNHVRFVYQYSWYYVFPCLRTLTYTLCIVCFVYFVSLTHLCYIRYICLPFCLGLFLTFLRE